MLSFALFLPGCLSVRSSRVYLDITKTDLCDVTQCAVEHPSFCVGEFPSDTWWEMFGDDQLNRFMELALCCHPDINEARLRVGIAYQKALEVRSKLLPYVELFADYFRQRQSQYNLSIPDVAANLTNNEFWFDTGIALIQANYELDIWGKNRAAYYSQLGQIQVQRAELAQVRLILSTTLAQAYFSLQSHLKQKEILICLLQTREELLSLVQQRWCSGMADAFPPYDVDAQIAEVQAQIIQMEALIELDQHALSALVGNLSSICCHAEALCVQPAASYECPFPLPSSLPLDLIARRPDIMATLWQIQSMAYNVKVAKAQFLPNLDLFGSIGQASFFLTQFFSHPALSVMMHATSILPFYTGGNLPAKLREAQLDWDLAIEQYNQTILIAVQQVSDAVTYLKTAEERLGQVNRELGDRGSLYALYNQKFQNGVDPKMPVLQSADTFFEIQGLEEQVRLDRMLALVLMIRSLGGGYCGF